MNQHEQRLSLCTAFDTAAPAPSAWLETELRGALSADALDRLACGVAIVDGAGKLMLCNATAQAMFALGTCLKLVQERVTAVQAGESRRLHSLMYGALGPHEPRGGAMLLRDGAQQSYALVVELTTPALRARTGATATMYITDLGARPAHIHASRVRAMFGFTAAETRIAIGIADGGSVQSVAVVAGVTYESARFTLKRIYEKLGVHKQGELVALIRSALPPLRECGARPDA
ncbi:MAG: helix-turn-helix transcriptional regulator [Gammaproteobacteria bacterium]|nr:helix-turn-helix transcriptional regulator [Gammaproteobacteria bacterium]